MRSVSPKKRLLHWKKNSEGLPDLAHLSIWQENTWRDKCPIRQINRKTDKTGTVIEIPRVYPKLSENAYPCIFPGCPSYLNEKIKERSLTIQRKEKVEITSFECLKEKLLMRENPISDFLSKNNVLIQDCESSITFLFINYENCPSILKSLKINTYLPIIIFNNNRELNISSVGKILNNPPRLTYFSELLNILNTVNVFEEICSINSVPHYVMAIQ
ncbi:hypothetical protein TNCV_1069181 [Trichonephila clavipes]|nr:hypothetical protein TNCV_1069181 [Trichonephila clavipes]